MKGPSSTKRLLQLLPEQFAGRWNKESEAPVYADSFSVFCSHIRPNLKILSFLSTSDVKSPCVKKRASLVVCDRQMRREGRNETEMRYHRAVFYQRSYRDNSLGLMHERLVGVFKMPAMFS